MRLELTTCPVDFVSKRFYLAEIVIALGHLHESGIIHRDLKPENILLDGEGHVAVTDFGLAVEQAPGSETRSFCGTDEYMAPEMIKSEAYGKAVDWWALGALAFEMLTGKPPFTHKNRRELHKRILEGKIKFPSYLSGDACSLIKALMNRDVSKRLGTGPVGTKNVMTHPFFKKIKFKDLFAKKLIPPFQPCKDPLDPLDISNFSCEWTRENPKESKTDLAAAAGDTWTDGNAFRDFTYTSPSFLEAVMGNLQITQAAN